MPSRAAASTWSMATLKSTTARSPETRRCKEAASTRRAATSRSTIRSLRTIRRSVPRAGRGTGGDAMGGGLFFAGFNMEINHTSFASNMAIGGQGGHGAASTSVAVAGGRGGNGGNGQGGGMYIASAHVINLDHDQFDNNVALGGAVVPAGTAPWARLAHPGTMARMEPRRSGRRYRGRRHKWPERRPRRQRGHRRQRRSWRRRRAVHPSDSGPRQPGCVRFNVAQGGPEEPAESAARAASAEPAAMAAWRRWGRRFRRQRRRPGEMAATEVMAARAEPAGMAATAARARRRHLQCGLAGYQQDDLHCQRGPGWRRRAQEDAAEQGEQAAPRNAGAGGTGVNTAGAASPLLPGPAGCRRGQRSDRCQRCPRC